jgi:hypothetical protein
MKPNNNPFIIKQKKMKKLSIMLAAAAALFMFPSCEKVVGEGPVQTEIRSLADFNGVLASIPGKVNYKVEPIFKVELIAQQNILDAIETSKINGHLLIKVKNTVRLKTNENIIVNVSAPSADYFHLSGSGNLEVTGNAIATNMDIGISGSGNISIANITVTDKVNINVSGSGDVTLLAGTSKNEELRISGSGKIMMDGVAAEKATTTISGSGDMQVKVSQLLDATISGSGSVYYRGTPVINTHISGSGRVRQL